jgi:hypothetical protein
MTLVITKCSLRTINPCNHDYPGMGWGLAHSLFILVRESHNYIRVRGTVTAHFLLCTFSSINALFRGNKNF